MRLTARFTFAATLLAVTLLGSASHAALITQRPAAPESTAVTQVRHSAGDANELIRTAVAQRFGGDADGAVRTLGKVLEADPDSAEALGYQALAQFDRGDFRSAADIFRQAHHRAASLRAMLGRYLALGRIGENADAELKVVKASLPFEQTTSLDYVVAGYYLGQRSLADLSAAARTIEDVCTVQFYTRSDAERLRDRRRRSQGFRRRLSEDNDGISERARRTEAARKRRLSARRRCRQAKFDIKACRSPMTVRPAVRVV